MRAYAPRLIETRGSSRIPATISLLSEVTCTALTPIGGHRGVIMTNRQIECADKDNPDHMNLAFGITTGALAQGDTGTVQTQGLLTEPSWNWEPSQPIFLGNYGYLTQTVPTTGFLLQMGVATAPREMNIAIQAPIELA